MDFLNVEKYQEFKEYTVEWFLSHARPKFFWERERRMEKRDRVDIQREVNEKISLCKKIKPILCI